MRIALLFNSRPAAISDASPDDSFEEYDTPDTIASIAGALAEFGRVEPIEADRDLPRTLRDGGYDFAFNIAEGWGGRSREAHAAAVCELLGIPFTHSDPLTLALTLDKAMARRVVAPDVPVAPAVLVRRHENGRPLNLRYPVVVKPNDEGSSKGIRDDSVAADDQQARGLIARLHDRYECPALVEEYLSGPEITVGLIGNGSGTRILGSMEIAPADDRAEFLYSVEAKRAFRERVRYFVPPRITQGQLREIERSAIAAYRLLGCRDIARLDFRLDREGRPCFLECNPLPGLNPETSDIVILSRSVISYQDLIRRIPIEAARRYGMELH